jgi:hypothetical protein
MTGEPVNERRPAERPSEATREKERRFRIVKLEERIAPGGGGPQGAYKTGFCYPTEPPCELTTHNNCHH